jgi:pyruvate/2-oxoglutarate dehydrogenase complex dihydrolipoamide acyltransferase (E2) component
VVCSNLVAYVAGDAVKEDDVIAQIETDKVTIDVKYTATAPGMIAELMVKEGDTVVVGQDIARVEEGVAEAKPAAPAAAAAPQPAAAAPPPPPPPPKPAAAPEVRSCHKNDRMLAAFSATHLADLMSCAAVGRVDAFIDAVTRRHDVPRQGTDPVAGLSQMKVISHPLPPAAAASTSSTSRSQD